MCFAPKVITFATQARGSKQYELTDHLGNIRTVIPDIKEPQTEPTQATNYLTDNDNFRLPTLTLNNYYPYGMLQAGRSKNAGGYRFGFQGQEADNKIGGLGQHTTAQFWEYDTWAARRWNLDPKPQVGISDYAVFANSPIIVTDPNGDEPESAGNPDLDKENLEKNPDYRPLTVEEIRKKVTDEKSGLQPKHEYMAGGTAFEKAFFGFQGRNLPKNTIPYTVYNLHFDALTTFFERTVIPDAIHETMSEGSNGGKIIFLYSVIIEVKAMKTVTLSTSDYQIKVYIERLSYTRGKYFEYATSYKAASFTLVIPHGSTIGEDVKKECNAKMVNLYVSYSFKNIHSGKVVFSNPEYVTGPNKESAYDSNTKLSDAAPLDIRGAINHWKYARDIINK